MTQSDEGPRPISEIRSEARHLLRQGAVGSVSGAFKFLAATVATLGVFGGGLATLNLFSLIWLEGLGTLACLFGLLAFAYLEWLRLSRHRELLKEILETERYYELLLADARAATEQAVTEKRELQIQMEIFRAFGELVQSRQELASVENVDQPNQAGPHVSRRKG